MPYILTGCIFYIFGLKWSSEYAKFWYATPPQRVPREGHKLGRMVRFRRAVLDVMNSHPLEGSLKLIATAVGLSGMLVGGLPDTGVVSIKVVHATIYLFFAFSGLVDVLHFYFPRNVSDGLTKMALAQSFFIEGFLFVWASVSESPVVNMILAGIVWSSSLAVTLELVWPEVKLLRGVTTLLHGGWIAHMVRVYRMDVLTTQQIALTFSWHVAAATTVTLLVVAVTRSCGPRMPREPPEIPIYDYCQESEIRQVR